MLQSLSICWNKVRFCNFHSSTVKMEQVAKRDPTSPSEDLRNVPVRPFDRFLLVWSGMFKNLKEVPDQVLHSKLVKSHNICRIKACHYMTVLTVLAAVYYAMSGKRDSEKGLTVIHMNRKWHEEYNKKMDEAQKPSDAS